MIFLNRKYLKKILTLASLNNNISTQSKLFVNIGIMPYFIYNQLCIKHNIKKSCKLYIYLYPGILKTLIVK
jgi:hypothetical protein